jgi:uncharacterized membrane protein YbaN (DUF454 family)
MLKRAVLFGLGAVLVPLGLIGLVVPILPGVLFLAAAAFCFAATSPKLTARMQRHPAWRGWRLRWRESRGLPLFRRVQLAFWLTAEAVMNATRRR